MSKKDVLDKKINYLQALQLAFIAILVSLIGYSATHYKEMETFLLIGAIVIQNEIYTACAPVRHCRNPVP